MNYSTQFRAMPHTFDILRRYASKNVATQLVSAVLAASALVPVHAADIAIVVDDSQGMCGYLDGGPDTMYRAAIRKLQAVVEKSGTSVDMYRLSKIGKGNETSSAVATGVKAVVALDKLANGKTCDFGAETSPLHLAQLAKLDSHKLVILLTDLIFDEGAAGGVESRVKFVNEAKSWAEAKANVGTVDGYFTSGMGIIGLRSTFTGTYFPAAGGAGVKLKSVERPFYMAWKSNDNVFAFPVLRELTKLAKTPSDLLALDFFPLPKASGQFVVQVPLLTKKLLSDSSQTVVSYRYKTRTARPQADAILVNRCFKRNGLQVDFNVACDAEKSNGDRQLFAVRLEDETKLLEGAVLWVAAQPLLGVKRKVDRLPGHTSSTLLDYVPFSQADKTLQPTTLVDKDGKPKQNLSQQCLGAGLDCIFPPEAVQKLAGADASSLQLRISLNPTDRIFMQLGRKAGSAPSANDQQVSKWQDVFEVDSGAGQSQMEKSTDGWNADVDVCITGPVCSQAQKKTLGLNNFVLAMSARIGNVEKAVDLLNQAAKTNPFELTIKRVYKATQ